MFDVTTFNKPGKFQLNGSLFRLTCSGDPQPDGAENSPRNERKNVPILGIILVTIGEVKKSKLMFSNLMQTINFPELFSILS